MIRGGRVTGIVLGLYIAALLLMGPLHFLMHPAAASSCADKDSQTPGFDSVKPGKTAYNLHHCPACFLHSHSIAGEQGSPYEAVLIANSSPIGAFAEHIFDAEKSSSLHNRAPPFVL